MNIQEAINVDVRFSFTWAFVTGAFQLARRAAAIESTPPDQLTEELKQEHRANVVGSLMQATAAIESEIAEVLAHGPGHHLGSEHVDLAARRFLAPLADVLDRQPAIERYEMVLHILQRPALPRGTEPWQSTSLLIKLRNEVVHYRSRWDSEMSGQKLWSAIRNLKHSKPPFIDEHSLYFPHQVLSAACAAWGAETATRFIDEFYLRLGVPSPLDGHRANLRL